MSIPDYFEFNEIENVRCSIELCSELAQRLEEQPTYFKWLVIATHDMLQGAMVCALSGSANIGALTKASQREFLQLSQIRRLLSCVQNTYPTDQNLAEAQQELEKVTRSREKLADFKELLKRAQNKEWSGSGTVEPLSLTEEQKKCLIYLNDLRNNFVHFQSAIWDIETTRLYQSLEVAFEATEHLMNERQVRVEENILQKMKSDLSKIKSLLKK